MRWRDASVWLDWCRERRVNKQRIGIPQSNQGAVPVRAGATAPRGWFQGNVGSGIRSIIIYLLPQVGGADP
jgi:hypothetical protein